MVRAAVASRRRAIALHAVVRVMPIGLGGIGFTCSDRALGQLGARTHFEVILCLRLVRESPDWEYRRVHGALLECAFLETITLTGARRTPAVIETTPVGSA